MNTNDQKILKKLYGEICKNEKLNPISLQFKRVGKGGGVCSFIGKRPVSIAIDLNRISAGSAYVLCHEVAHQIEISQKGNATHNKSWEKTFETLRSKYENCALARKLIW